MYVVLKILIHYELQLVDSKMLVQVSLYSSNLKVNKPNKFGLRLELQNNFRLETANTLKLD